MQAPDVWTPWRVYTCTLQKHVYMEMEMEMEMEMDTSGDSRPGPGTGTTVVVVPVVSCLCVVCGGWVRNACMNAFDGLSNVAWSPR